MNARKLLFIAATLLASSAQGQNLSGKIIFSLPGSTDAASDSICTLEPNGTGFTFITHGCRPRLSPDGNYLAFIYGTNSDRKLNNLYFKEPTGSPYEFYNNGSLQNLFNFDFTPTETTLVFDWQNGFYTQLSNDPNGQTLNAGGLGVGDLSDEFPRVCKTDSAFVSHNPNSGLRTMPYNGPNAITIPNTEAGDLSPYWSADGQWIYFAKQYDNAPYKLHNIYRIHRDGTGLQQITNLPNHDTLGMTLVVTNNGQWVVAPARINGVVGLYQFRANPSVMDTTGYLIKAFNYLSTPCNNLWLGNVDSIFNNPLNVAEHSMIVTSIYPNPVKDGKIHITLAESAEQVQLLDVTGRSVATFEKLRSGQNTLNLPQLPSGNYYFTGKCHSGIFTEKITLGDN